MKKIYLLLLCLITLSGFSQTTCSTSAAFCANNSTGTTFPAGVSNGSAAPGPDYGCLFTQPNPAWYFFQVAQNGAVIIGIGGGYVCNTSERVCIISSLSNVLSI